MLSYLPGLYQDSRVTAERLQAEGVEFDSLRQALDETLDQFFVRTSTWGLDQWESELGLVPAADEPDSERQDRIVSRIRGTGTCTISVVTAVAEAYDQGSVEVTEQAPLYQVTVEFIDTRGVPPNIDDLKAAVEAIIPAHLQVIYQYRYTLWSELISWSLTWQGVADLGITWGALKTWKPA